MINDGDAEDRVEGPGEARALVLHAELRAEAEAKARARVRLQARQAAELQRCADRRDPRTAAGRRRR
ncbi:MAG: hypothetical protein R3A79_10510 [Nannocystaceae bacterium]